MDARETGFLNRMPVVLGAAILAGGLAGYGVLNQYGEAVLDQPIAATSPVQLVCRYCGVVEGVKELKASRADYGVSTISTSRDQAILMLLSALSGVTVTATAAPPKLYEVSVRMDDGSVRAVRANYAPKWRPGDRVKIIRNRLRSLS